MRRRAFFKKEKNAGGYKKRSRRESQRHRAAQHTRLWRVLPANLSCLFNCPIFPPFITKMPLSSSGPAGSAFQNPTVGPVVYISFCSFLLLIRFIAALIYRFKWMTTFSNKLLECHLSWAFFRFIYLFYASPV